MLTQEQKAKYEQIRQTAAADLESIDREIERELAAVKRRLMELQEDKKATKQVIDGACARLGLKADPAARPADARAQSQAIEELAVFER